MKDILKILKDVFKCDLVEANITKHYFNKDIKKMIKYLRGRMKKIYTPFVSANPYNTASVFIN